MITPQTPSQKKKKKPRTLESTNLKGQKDMFTDSTEMLPARSRMEGTSIGQVTHSFSNN